MEWLKAKYSCSKTVSKYRSSHSDGARRKKRDGSFVGLTPKYEPSLHVLVLVEGRKRKWKHGKD